MGGSMSRSSKIYAYSISLIGLPLGLYCIYSYISTLVTYADPSQELVQFGVLWALNVVCRCFPIYIRDDYAIDMSFICYLATILCKGPVFAVTMVLISTPFVVVGSNTEEKVYYHIFNIPFIKTAFNTSNFMISIFLSGVLFEKTGGVVGSLLLPGVLLPCMVAAFTYLLFNCGILLVLFSLDQKTPFFPALLKNLIEFFPNITASAPIGYFIAQFLMMKDGEYLVLLFMLPLLLARYSFVLYLDVKQNYYNMVKTLTAALEAKDQYTEGHSHRVEHYSELIARKMHRPSFEIENIKVAALLHDVGKIGIDDKILNKPGPLTQEERDTIMTHPMIGANILKNVKLNQEVRTAIIHHHERYDGGGYPDHTKGDEIPLTVYIIGLADAYDAMTSNRPYCQSLADEDVLEIVTKEIGKQFHPKVAAAFLDVLKDNDVKIQ
jgi:putative nucleotidyltransferase with HDIG domain